MSNFYPSLPISDIKTIITRHLPDPSTKMFIFGSRATGSARKWSDIDIGLLPSRPVSPSTLGNIQEELDESDIPYQVDVIDFSTTDAKFKSVALQKTIAI